MTEEARLPDMATLNERWKHIMEDPTVTAMVEATMPNTGRSFEEEDVEAYLARGLAAAKYFREILGLDNPEQPQ